MLIAPGMHTPGFLSVPIPTLAGLFPSPPDGARPAALASTSDFALALAELSAAEPRQPLAAVALPTGTIVPDAPAVAPPVFAMPAPIVAPAPDAPARATTAAAPVVAGDASAAPTFAPIAVDAPIMTIEPSSPDPATPERADDDANAPPATPEPIVAQPIPTPIEDADDDLAPPPSPAPEGASAPAIDGPAYPTPLPPAQPGQPITSDTTLAAPRPMARAASDARPARSIAQASAPRDSRRAPIAAQLPENPEAPATSAPRADVKPATIRPNGQDTGVSDPTTVARRASATNAASPPVAVAPFAPSDTGEPRSPQPTIVPLAEVGPNPVSTAPRPPAPAPHISAAAHVRVAPTRANVVNLAAPAPIPTAPSPAGLAPTPDPALAVSVPAAPEPVVSDAAPPQPIRSEPRSPRFDRAAAPATLVDAAGLPRTDTVVLDAGALLPPQPAKRPPAASAASAPPPPVRTTQPVVASPAAPEVSVSVAAVPTSSRASPSAAVAPPAAPEVSVSVPVASVPASSRAPGVADALVIATAPVPAPSAPTTAPSAPVATAPTAPADPATTTRVALPRAADRPSIAPARPPAAPRPAGPVPVEPARASDVFAGAIFAAHSATRAREDDPVAELAQLFPLADLAPTPAAPTQAAPRLDTAKADWIAGMIDHIEQLRDTAGGTDTTRIRLTPDALGGVDVRVHRDERGQVSVQIRAETPEARALLADAAPRLLEMAEARGLKLGAQVADASGGSQDRRQDRQPPQAATPAAPARARRQDDTDTTTDTRIA